MHRCEIILDAWITGLARGRSRVSLHRATTRVNLQPICEFHSNVQSRLSSRPKLDGGFLNRACDIAKVGNR